MVKKTHETPLDCKEIKPVNLKGNQPWIFIRRTDTEAHYFGHLIDVKGWLTEKDPDAGKDWRKGKGVTEDAMVGWYHDSKDMSLSRLWETVKEREA